MPSLITVTNRQRKLQIDVAQVGETAQKLSRSVFANLMADPPEHLDKRLITKLSKRGEFSLVLVSDRQIQKLNSQWMGKNSPTDVLSFPLELEPPPADEVPWEVGEIIVSLEKAQEQADSYGHSFDRELAFLIVHGMLHVLGFDHVEPDEEKDMFSRQRSILSASGFKR